MWLTVSSILRITRTDPSKLNDRIVTVREQEFFRKAIDKEEQKLRELDAEVMGLQLEVNDYEQKSQTMKAALSKAKKLRKNAEITIESLNDLSDTLIEEESDDSDDSSESSKTSATSLDKQIESIEVSLENTSYSGIEAIEKGLESTLENHRESAKASLQQAIAEYRRVQEDLDANNSFLDCVTRSLVTRIELRDQLSENIRHMKDVIGPRRRIPDEVWALVFWERVTEDEEYYARSRSFRDGEPPYTTLKLTWVCRLWRQIVMNQPSLWRYIAIPISSYLTQEQEDMVEHFRQHLQLYPPHIYMVPHYKGDLTAGTPLGDVLISFERIKYMEAYILDTFPSPEGLLEKHDLHIDELVLINDSEDSVIVTFSLRTIKNIKKISCHNVRPRIDVKGFQDHEVRLDSLHLNQYEVDRRETIVFLDRTRVINFEFTGYKWFIVHGIRPLGHNVILTHLTTLCMPFAILHIFDEHVSFPSLRSFTIILDLATNDDQKRAAWDIFSTTHRLRDVISTFGIINAVLNPLSTNDAALCCYFISRLPNIEKLVLEKGTAIPVLQEMTTNASTILSRIATIEISYDFMVTETQVLAFLQAIYTRKRTPLSLEVVNCEKLPGDAIRRLERVNEELKAQQYDDEVESMDHD
jgi:hypothetical protein